MQRAVGQTVMEAEILWARSLSVTTRALVCSSPLAITSAINDNVLYVDGTPYAYDNNNQSPFCWKGTWTEDNKKELWRLIPARTGPSDYYIVSVYAEQFLYASEFPVTSDAGGFAMKRVLVKHWNDVPDAAGIWRFRLLGGGKCTIYNARYDVFPSSPPDACDGRRRTVVAAPFRPLDDKRSARREWRINATLSKLETALRQFFSRKYNEAIASLTGILAQGEISAADRMKVLWYRMAANLLLQNDGFFQQDFVLATQLGGYPSYFFDTLAGKLPEDKKLIDRHHIIEEDWLMERKRASEINEDEEGDTAERADDSTPKATIVKKEPVPSAYYFFYQEKQQQVRDQNPGTNVGRIALLLAEKWHALSYKERAKYHKMHEDAKAGSED